MRLIHLAILPFRATPRWGLSVCIAAEAQSPWPKADIPSIWMPVGPVERIQWEISGIRMLGIKAGRCALQAQHKDRLIGTKPVGGICENRKGPTVAST